VPAAKLQSKMLYIYIYIYIKKLVSGWHIPGALDAFQHEAERIWMKECPNSLQDIVTSKNCVTYS
jgi:hypothetical protein